MTIDLSGARTNILFVILLLVPLVAEAKEDIKTPEHVTGTKAYPFDTVDPRYVDTPAIELPDSVAIKLELLTPEEVEFLKSGNARRFAGSVDETVEVLNERTPEEVKAWVQAMRQVVNHNHFHKEYLLWLGQSPVRPYLQTRGGKGWELI